MRGTEASIDHTLSEYSQNGENVEKCKKLIGCGVQKSLEVGGDASDKGFHGASADLSEEAGDARALVTASGRCENEDHVITGTASLDVPDGGWGWVCVLACALISVVGAGFIATFSITFLAIRERYNSSATATAWLYSVLLAVTMLGGPAATALLKRFGCRRCVMVAGLVKAASLILTAYAPSFPFLFFTLSIIGGLPNAVTFNAVFIIINQYFDKKKSRATAIAIMGRGIGVVIFAPILEMLLKEYGYSGAYLIIGGCFLNNVAFGALLWAPISSIQKIAGDVEEVVTDDKEEQNSETDDRNSSDMPNSVLKSGKTRKEYGGGGTSRDSETGCARSETGKVMKFMKFIKFLDLLLLKDTTFVTFCSCQTFVAMGASIAMICVAGLAREIGLPDSQMAMCMSLLGFVTILFRPVSGIIFDMGIVRQYRGHAYVMNVFFLGVVLCFSSLVRDLASYLCFLVAIAVFISATTTQEMVVLSDLVSKSRFPGALGLTTAFKGIGTIVGPPLGGLMEDRSGTYVAPFQLAGVFYLLGFLVFEVYHFYYTVIRKPKIKTNIDITAKT